MAGEDGNVLSLLQEFILPPESVQEQFQGLPTLYNPPSVVRDLRKYPLQEAISGRSRSRGRRTPGQDDGEDEESLQESDAYMYHVRESHVNLKLSTVIKDLLLDIAYHPGVKYWIAFLAVVVILELGRLLTNIIWFGLGAGGIIIINQAVWGPEEEDEGSNDSSEVESTEVVGTSSNVGGNSRNGVLSGSYWRSQGWMLTLPPVETQDPFPDYDAAEFHLRNTKPVFIRLDGPNLLISYPHPRHRIPKRRLWNDPLINNDIIFTQHQHYNMYGAKVEIVPAELPKKRCWSKKYPISITLACKDRHVGKLKAEVETPDPVETDAKGNAGVQGARKGEKLHGVVHKEEGKCLGKILFLFARTDREKDDWFRRLVAASKRHASHSKSGRSPQNSPDFINFISYMKHACPTLHIPTTVSAPVSSAMPNNNNRSTSSTNVVFETVLIPNMNPPSNPSPATNHRKSNPEHIINPSRGLMAPQFLNALLARLFYDFLRSPKWTHEVKQLIDKKLFFLRKPKMVQSLLVKELDLGNSLPVINHASSPVLDRQGLWVDLDITYTGTVVITIEAFINLLNMGRSAHDGESSRTGTPTRRSPFKSSSKFDSDDEDSGESSESEDELDLEESGGKLKSKKESDPQDNRGKIYKYADAIAKSSVMRNKHVQKVVGNIASTPFLLTVEIKHVVGSVAVNIPPVPNDRVWIGFRTNPEIDINAKPKVGQRVVSLSQVTGWIKKKLLLVFQRVMVCPNMVDVAIPLMEYDLPK